MAKLSDVLTWLFYLGTLVALGFFVHKVLWLVEYKRIQRGLVDEAIRSLRDGHATAISAWEEFAARAWSSALGQAEVHDASTFLQQVDEDLGRIRDDMKETAAISSRRSIEDLLGQALAGARQGSAAGKVTVLSLRRPGVHEDPRLTVDLDLRFPCVPPPRPPDRRLYELRARSRYGLIRRALVFFSGAADVVYSSQHVARMSQNVHVPTSVLVRRLSLVFLVLAVVILDLLFGIRTWLTGVMTELVRAPAPAHRAAESGFFAAHLGAILSFGVWMAVYGSIYLLMYFLIRRRYQWNVRRLREMSAEEGEAMRSIHERQVDELARWGRAYGRSLDGAVEISLRHAETLVDHYAHRLRLRLAGPALLDGAKAIADALFLRLPESRGDLVDFATQHEHSLEHHLWPRAEEMGYQVRFAQIRAAWQHLEIAVGDLRRERPDPARAHDLWRSAVLYATIFAPLVPTGIADALRGAYAQTVTACVAETDKDLAELDRRLSELAVRLHDQLDFARTLALSKIELASQHVTARAAERSAEVIQVRERARLEAMAFEI